MRLNIGAPRALITEALQRIAAALDQRASAEPWRTRTVTPASNESS